MAVVKPLKMSIAHIDRILNLLKETRGLYVTANEELRAGLSDSSVDYPTLYGHIGGLLIRANAIADDAVTEINALSWDTPQKYKTGSGNIAFFAFDGTAKTISAYSNPGYLSGASGTGPFAYLGAGDIIRVSRSENAGENDGQYEIDSINADCDVITLAGTPGLEDNADDESAVIDLLDDAT